MRMWLYRGRLGTKKKMKKTDNLKNHKAKYLCIKKSKIAQFITYLIGVSFTIYLLISVLDLVYRYMRDFKWWVPGFLIIQILGLIATVVILNAMYLSGDEE